MTFVSLADSCRHLGIDPKTLRRWLATAPFPGQPHPHDAHRKGLTEEQLRWLAHTHHRSLPVLPQEPPQPAPEAEPLALPDDLLEVTQRLGTTSIRDLIAMIERPNLPVQEVQ